MLTLVLLYYVPKLVNEPIITTHFINDLLYQSLSFLNIIPHASDMQLNQSTPLGDAGPPRAVNLGQQQSDHLVVLGLGGKVQRGLSLFIPTLDVGSLFQEYMHNLRVLLLDGYVQRRVGRGLACLVNSAALLNQQLGYVLVAPPQGVAQEYVVCPLGVNGHAALTDELLDSF